MKAFPQFSRMPEVFWASVKFVSQEIGYKDRRTNAVKVYSEQEITKLFELHRLSINTKLIRDIAYYSKLRAAALNDFAKSNLMDVSEAHNVFSKLYEIYSENGFLCSIPMNKQKGDKKQTAYFTAIINILTEKTIREEGLFEGTKGFDDDPRSLMYVIDDEGYIQGASSRRLDGAYPSLVNPQIMWEIKEYYYTTTFGSRVADAVYETQLDGYEMRDISERVGYPIKHVLFVDGYKTWWTDGKPYLCRIIDAVNAGLLDEVIIGREVLERWPEFIRENI